MLLAPSAAAKLILLDCGEGSLEQLEAMLGHEPIFAQGCIPLARSEMEVETTGVPRGDDGRMLPLPTLQSPHPSLPASVEGVLRRLGIVWLSHHHADHHAGVTAVLERRADLAAQDMLLDLKQQSTAGSTPS